MMNLHAIFVTVTDVTADHSNSRKPHGYQRVMCRLWRKADWIPLSFQATIVQALKVTRILPLILMNKCRLVTTWIQREVRNW